MVLKVFPKGDFLGLLICCSQKKSDQVTLKIPFVAISFKSNLRMTGLLAVITFRHHDRQNRFRKSWSLCVIGVLWLWLESEAHVIFQISTVTQEVSVPTF